MNFSYFTKSPAFPRLYPFLFLFSFLSPLCGEIILEDNFQGTVVTFPDGRTKRYPDPRIWAFTFLPGIKWPDSYGDGTNWLQGNDECQTYVTPFLTQIRGRHIPSHLRYDPFEITKDGLYIKADVLSKEQREVYQVEAPYRIFGSGMLLSRKAFTYGRVRLVAKLPSTKGSWPAFWLLPASFEWPPEIDVFEGMAWGCRTNQIHSGIIPKKTESKPTGKWYKVHKDLSKDFHEYGLDWESTQIICYLDGQELWKVSTPSSMHQNMYLIINLAVGGKWYLMSVELSLLTEGIRQGLKKEPNI